MAGKHDVGIDLGQSAQRLDIEFAIEIDGSAPAKIAGQQGADDIAAEDKGFAFMYETIGRTSPGVSGQVQGFDVITKDLYGFTVLDCLIDGCGNECFVIEIAAASLITSGHGIGSFRMCDQPDVSPLEVVCCPGMIEMSMGEKTGMHVIDIQIPVTHILADLIECLSAPAVEHDQSLPGIENITVTILKSGVLSHPGQSIEVTAYLEYIL